MVGFERRLLQAVGIDAGRVTPPQVYEIGGRIIKDEELTRLCLPHIVDHVLRIGVRETVIRAMPERERQALRGRVLR